MTQTLKVLIPLSITFALLVATNVILAAWTAPSGSPSAGNNVDAPLNVSGTSQIKTGGLTTGSLSVIGDQTITQSSPSIKFNDNTVGEGDYWTHVNGGRFYFLNDTDSNGSWESPYPLVIDGPQNYSIFENKVRANSFCDRSGGDCFTPAKVQSAITKTDGPTAINVSGTSQIKTGGLSTGNLSVIGGQTLTSGAPRIKFNDTTSRADDYFLYTNSDRFYILSDSDDNGSWDGTIPMYISAVGNYATFENQVRANRFCDRNGNNCLVPGQSITGAKGDKGDRGAPGAPAPSGYSCKSQTYLYTLAVVYTDVSRPSGCPNGNQSASCVNRACTDRGYDAYFGGPTFIDYNPGPWSLHTTCYKWEPITFCGYY
jgi:hypothetical protein